MINPEKELLIKKDIFERPLTYSEQEVRDKIYKKKSVRESNVAKKSMRDMDAFLEIYGQYKTIREIIEKDKAWVEKMRNSATEKSKTERADLLEKILEEQCETADWLGENAFVTSITEYDDRVNHTDLVIEWENEDGSMLKLAVDCTVTEDPEVLEKKYGYSLAGIRDRCLTRIKYFQSSKNFDEIGPIDMIPRIVLNVRKEKLDNLCSAIIQKEVQYHYMQYYILLNIQKQMQYQLNYIEKYFQRNIKISNPNDKKRDQISLDQMKSKVTEILNIVEKIMQDKKSSLGPEVVKRAEEDLVASNPTQYLEQAQTY